LTAQGPHVVVAVLLDAFLDVPMALGCTRRSSHLVGSSAQVTEKRVGGEEPKRTVESE
jgi:hypothetical protein